VAGDVLAAIRAADDLGDRPRARRVQPDLTVADRVVPSLMSLPATNWTVSMAMAKQIPCAGRMTAVLTPITRPAESSSGPPEFPGFKGASVWMTLSMSRPDPARRDRPRALTTPVVTVHWKPYGLPMATTSCPGRRERDVPRGAACRPWAFTRTTARSVLGSSPTIWAPRRLPSLSVTSTRSAPFTTWLFVRMNPSGVKRKPDPVPARASRPWPRAFL
jgi:hypothetical protein